MRPETPVTIGIEVEANASEDFFCDNDYPDGWEGAEEHCGIEFKFDGPSMSLRDTFERLDTLEDYMDEHSLTRFRDCGTHVHFGVMDPLRTRYGQQGERAISLLYGYLTTRLNGVWPLVVARRRRNSYCGPCWNPNTSLWRIHNYLVSNMRGNEQHYAAISTRHRFLPTFEVRMFPGTNKLQAVKGYVALFINMITAGQEAISNFDLEAFEILQDETRRSSTQGILRNPYSYGLPELRSEVAETPFLSEEILDWMDRTVKERSRLAPFNYQFSRISSSTLAAAA